MHGKRLTAVSILSESLNKFESAAFNKSNTLNRRQVFCGESGKLWRPTSSEYLSTANSLFDVEDSFGCRDATQGCHPTFAPPVLRPTHFSSQALVSKSMTNITKSSSLDVKSEEPAVPFSSDKIPLPPPLNCLPLYQDHLRQKSTSSSANTNNVVFEENCVSTAH